MKRIFIKVEGIVQGVGFRPFVYKLAMENNLKGWVNNNSEGVYIDIEGEESGIENFLYNLKNKPCALAKIDKITIEKKELSWFEIFEIRESKSLNDKITLISPDVATCSHCLEEVRDPKNRRYRYAFTNCTNCGPRFSIIKSIPYDRDKTTMNAFQMCKNCNNEYLDPLDRRFHAQPNACSKCGPSLWVEDSSGNYINSTDALDFTVEALREGKIFGIKGIGGFHLCCNGKSEESISKLRLRKQRPDKPLALMMKDLETVKRYCDLNSIEQELLLRHKRPIVLLRKKRLCNLPENIAPNQSTLGVMLPYTPLHELLFDKDVKVLVMTSANLNGLPIEFENESAVKNLAKVVDYFLMHNRNIIAPVDDSVVRVINEDIRMIRRARGYVPEPVKQIGICEVLACGANMLNTFAIVKEGFVFLSQHNGDLENLETFENYKRNIEYFKKLFCFEPKYICCDMHEDYISTRYALKQNKPVVKVQHHHAHIASCMAENNVEEKVIGIAFDGTGYGTDDKIWGGEFLVCDFEGFERKAHLDYAKMPGGERAVKEPWRMAVTYIYKALKGKTIGKYSCEQILLKLYGEKALNIVKIIEANINCPETSSMGRLFDAVASIIGLRNKITYEGQAAMELEALTKDSGTGSYSYEILKDSEECILDVSNTIIEIVYELIYGKSKEEISLKFHNTIVNLTLQMSKKLREESGINKIALSGGVFQNAYLLENITLNLEKESFTVYTHKNIPCNDAGISLGQIAVSQSKFLRP